MLNYYNLNTQIINLFIKNAITEPFNVPIDSSPNKRFYWIFQWTTLTVKCSRWSMTDKKDAGQTLTQLQDEDGENMNFAPWF